MYYIKKYIVYTIQYTYFMWHTSHIKHNYIYIYCVYVKTYILYIYVFVTIYMCLRVK